MLKPLQYGCSSDNEMPRSPRMNRINEGPRVGLFLFGVSGCPALALPSAVMTQPQPRNRLHGITLERLLLELVEHMGWEAMRAAAPIRCFTHDPSIASSLKFLRRTPWARARRKTSTHRHLLCKRWLAKRRALDNIQSV